MENLKPLEDHFVLFLGFLIITHPRLRLAGFKLIIVEKLIILFNRLMFKKRNILFNFYFKLLFEILTESKLKIRFPM